MTLRLPSDLMARPAEEASRILALSYLRQLSRARTRLEDPQDLEALHDFRVGLRRLRSSLRAYRMQLKDSVNKKMEDSLRKLMRATNAGRDAEVQLNWLRKQGERVQPEETQGLFWLIGRLEGRKSETLDPTTVEVSRQFGKAAAKFRRRLGTLKVEIGPGPGKKQPTFGQITGQAIQQHVARLEKDLKEVRGAADVKQAHRARVAVKRLRYLLEPVARRHSRARDLVARLKETQDQLGELHDMHVLAQAIASSLQTVSDSHPDHQSEPGLRSLERLAQEQIAAAFDGFNSMWRGDRAIRFLARANAIGTSLKEESPTATHDAPTLRLRDAPGADAVPSLANVNHEHAV
jgi:CHAD domain-containing protein